MPQGDIYFWSWKEVDERSQRAGTTYWCKDQYCVLVENPKGDLVFIDTHKYNEYASDKLFDYESLRDQYMTVVDTDKVDLKFLGNVNDYEQTSKWDVEDYNEKDILIIPCHSGYRKVYLKKVGAKPDKNVIVDNLKYKIEEKKSIVRCAEMDIVSYQKELDELEKI